MTHEELRAMLVDAGLGRVADVIVREARPSIRITPHAVEDEDILPLGASKFGGSPDLPPGMAWPRYNDFPLAFVAQINLAEVAPYDVAKILPPTGLLHFFFEYEHWYDVPMPHPEMWRVTYLAGDHRTLERTIMPPPLPTSRHSGPFRPCMLAFAEEMTVPNYDEYIPETLTRFAPVAPFTEDEINAYYEVGERLSGIAGALFNIPIHRMLGYADPVQNDLHTDEKILLLQVDSDNDPDTHWGDTGCIFYFVDREALAHGDVSSIRFEEQSS